MQVPADRRFMDIALAEAMTGLAAGGVPVGSCIVIDDAVIGRGHNRRVQLGNPILHGEMDALRDAGRRSPEEYRRATLYTTLSPCSMCSGAILLFGIPRVVLGENTTFRGDEDRLTARGVTVHNLDLAEAKTLMHEFRQRFPEVWREDIGAPK